MKSGNLNFEKPSGPLQACNGTAFTNCYRCTYINEGKSLVLLQVNCKSIYKVLEFLNLVDTYDPDIIIDTESWFREEIGNTEIFRTDFTTFRRDRHARGGGVFICVKIILAARSYGVTTNSR
jgi:hypothetical protein